MAATPKPVRKHAKSTLKTLKKKYPQMGFDREHAKGIAKAHAEQGLVTKKGALNRDKVKKGLDESRKSMRSKKK